MRDETDETETNAPTRNPQSPAADPGELFAAFAAAHPQVRHVDMLLFDAQAIARGKRCPIDAMPRLIADGLGLPASLYALTVTGDDVQEVGLANHSGDKDYPCRLLVERLAPMPWAGPQHGQVLLRMGDDRRRGGAGPAFWGEPRGVLEAVVARLAADGLTAIVAHELEVYLTRPELGPDGLPRPPDAAGFTNQVLTFEDLEAAQDVLDAMHAGAHAQNLPVDTLINEYGPGQFEINLRHRPDAVAAADDAVLFKRLVRGVARSFGHEATFMAKPYASEAGSGLHLHVSLRCADGRLLFRDGGFGMDGETALKAAVAGLQAILPEAAAILLPNANSFRRLQPGSYAPVSVSWGEENRTTAIRLPQGAPEARRLELRLPGADANPYLVTAVLLAGIHHGISHKLKPSAPADGDAYAADAPPAPTIPVDWSAALSRFAAAEILPRYMDARFLRLWRLCRDQERQQFQRSVTPLEIAWYRSYA